MEGNKTVFVVIVTYNAEKWIDKWVSSLRASTLKVQTVVVDNGSSDNTVSILQNNHKDIVLLQPEKNLGFGMANNLGIKHALKNGGDYVFLLNQDAWVTEETIFNLVNQAVENPDFGVVSPIHLNGKGSALDLSFISYISKDKCPGLITDLYFQSLKEIYPILFVNAAAWLISRECLEDVGGFNPLFFMYGEDNEFIKRVKKFGFKVGVVPSAVAFHDREKRANPTAKADSRRWYEVDAKTILLDTNLTFSQAYIKFLKRSFADVERLVRYNFPLFLSFHSRLGEIKEVRRMIDKRGGFRW